MVVRDLLGLCAECGCDPWALSKLDGAAQLYGRENLAIYAYGSLLSDPGAKLAPHIVARIPQPSPWPIEYGRRA